MRITVDRSVKPVVIHLDDLAPYRTVPNTWRQRLTQNVSAGFHRGVARVRTSTSPEKLWIVTRPDADIGEVVDGLTARVARFIGADHIHVDYNDPPADNEPEGDEGMADQPSAELETASGGDAHGVQAPHELDDLEIDDQEPPRQSSGTVINVTVHIGNITVRRGGVINIGTDQSM